MARETEVENLDAAFRGDEHILGLEVAMDDALRVSGDQSVCDAAANLDGTLPRDRVAIDAAAAPRGDQEAAEGAGVASDGGWPSGTARGMSR
jgi:hypothetical protein